MITIFNPINKCFLYSEVINSLCLELSKKSEVILKKSKDAEVSLERGSGDFEFTINLSGNGVRLICNDKLNERIENITYKILSPNNALRNYKKILIGYGNNTLYPYTIEKLYEYIRENEFNGEIIVSSTKNFQLIKPLRMIGQKVLPFQSFPMRLIGDLLNEPTLIFDDSEYINAWDLFLIRCKENGYISGRNLCNFISQESATYSGDGGREEIVNCRTEIINEIKKTIIDCIMISRQ